MANRTLIIAEAGVNHNGDLELAKQLIDVAANAGADYVKFQTYSADRIVSRSALKAEYQQQTTDASETFKIQFKERAYAVHCATFCNQ